MTARLPRVPFAPWAAAQRLLRLPSAPYWAAGILLAAGALYGAVLSAVQVAAGATIRGIPVDRIPGGVLVLGNVLGGVAVVMVVHGGATLIVWLMCRAVGGPGGLGLLYRATAFLLPWGLPALPALAFRTATQSAMPVPPLLLAGGGAGAVLAALALYHLIRATQGLSPLRAAAATFLILLFSGSIALV